MQKWNKELWPETAAASRKQMGIQQDHNDNFQIGDHETNSWIFCHVMKNLGLDIVEGQPL
jgi:hypothetical protein